jgi:hypothetical protein
MYIPLIGSVLSMMVLVSYLLYGEYENNPDILHLKGYIATVVSTAVISLFIVALVGYSLIRDT